MERHDVVRRVWRELAPHLEEQGYELIEVEFAREGQVRVLRLFIDRKDGSVTLDDCQAASQLANPLLDAVNAIEGSYTLEISSPGFDRPLRKPEDFVRFAGERVKVTARAPVAGRRSFSGILRGFGDGLVTLECGGTSYEVHIENIRKAKLDR